MSDKDILARLEDAITAPAAKLPPHTPREEIAAVANMLRRIPETAPGSNLHTDAVGFWLHETAERHVYDGQGFCAHDEWMWPCPDISQAHHVASTWFRWLDSSEDLRNVTTDSARIGVAGQTPPTKGEQVTE